MDTISIIVPMYNMQDYIGRCLDSLVNQTYQDLEIVCVDDGSTDMTGDICKEYQKHDNRICYYKIPNGGVSRARNYALSLITGKWFAFIDSDDWIEPDYFERLYKNAVDFNCSISACTFQKNTNYTLGYNKEAVKVYTFQTPKECIRNYILSTHSMEGMSTNKIYLTEKYKDIRFDIDIKVNEDCLYTHNIMKQCDKACWCSAPMYHWYVRENSACHTKKLKCDFSAANVFLILYNETLSFEDVEIQRALKRNYIYAVIKVLRYAKCSKKNIEVAEAIKRCKEWRKETWNLFSNKMKILHLLYVGL